MKLKKGDLVYSLGYAIPNYCEDLGEVQVVRGGMVNVEFNYKDVKVRKCIVVIADERKFEKAEVSV